MLEDWTLSFPFQSVFSEEEMKALYTESVELYQEIWERYFQDNASVLKMFKVFSLQLMEKDIVNITDCLTFGREYEEELSKHYCEEATFKAEYEEDKGIIFTAAPIDRKYELHDELKLSKRHVFRNYLWKVNPCTQKPWTSKEVVMQLLQSKEESKR